MHLVRVGNYIINLNQVTYTEGNSQCLSVYFSAPLTRDGGIDSLQPDFVKLEGRQAHALFEYLDYLVEDDLNPSPAAAKPSTLGAQCSGCGLVHDVSGRITGDRIWCPCGNYLTVDHAH